MYITTLYTLNYYEDKYFISLFARFKYKVRVYAHILLKRGNNNHALLYIHINAQSNYNKKYT